MLVGFSQPVIMDDVTMNPTTLHNPERSRGQGEKRKEVQRLPKETQNNHKGMHKDSTEIQTNNKEAQKDHKEMKNTQ